VAPAVFAQSNPDAPPPVTTHTPPKSISIQEMLVIGPSSPKLHALAMITQGKVPGGIDESFLPGLKVCSQDSALPIRSVTARILGQHFIQGQQTPNPEAVSILLKLAKDPESDVRYSAVYYGLSQLQNKSPKVLECLLEVAAENREHDLYQRIVSALADNKEEVTKILNQKLADDQSVVFYEIYEDFAGAPPPNAEKYLQMPSSRPYLYVFKVKDSSPPDTLKTDLEKTLKKLHIKNPDISFLESADPVLALKTYLTKDRIAVKKAFSKPDAPYRIMQEMWLTPQIEIQIDALRKKQNQEKGAQ
jgi:hypothetical protein